MRPRAAILVALLVAFAAASPVVPAAAGKVPGARKARWATVNICDTPKHPNTIGIRASMPRGKSSDEKLFMRFQVQYLSQVDGKWHHVTQGGDSGFVAVKRPRGKARQKGWSFQISPNSDTIRLRGMVTMEWRRGGEVVRRARERTRGGHKNAADADPPGYSAADCTIRRSD
ncbi:MAG: hypothetical protein ACRDKY_00480 [Solirubrobacteraceae bacterium]